MSRWCIPCLKVACGYRREREPTEHYALFSAGSGDFDMCDRLGGAEAGYIPAFWLRHVGSVSHSSASDLKLNMTKGVRNGRLHW